MKGGILLAVVVGLVGSAMGLFERETWTSGYISIQGEGNSLFYILFQARNRTPSTPLAVWLSGGPGCASTLGLFEENGPYKINRRTLDVEWNQYSWNEQTDMLYVDQPLGTGFSTNVDNSSICRNETCIADNFYIFLTKFMQSCPQYAGRPLFLFGESYAGRYIPAIAAHVTKAQNPNIQLKGVAIGNGFIEEATQIATDPYYLYENEVIGFLPYLLLKLTSGLCQLAIASNADYVDRICDLDSLGLVNLTNPSNIHDPEPYFRMHAALRRKLNDPEWLRLLEARKSLSSLCNPIIPELMKSERPLSQREDLEFILERKLNVLLYYGDFDSVCNWRGGDVLSRSLQWPGKEAFNAASMQEWKLNGTVVGWTRSSENLMFLRLHQAGHIAPFDQPRVTLAMIHNYLRPALLNLV